LIFAIPVAVAIELRAILVIRVVGPGIAIDRLGVFPFAVGIVVSAAVSLSAILIIAGPLLIIGLLFLATSNFSTYETIKKVTVVD